MKTALQQPALNAKNLTVAYGKHAVLRETSLAITPGAITGLIGPNGCGKSTLLRTLGGLLRPRSGSVTLHGQAIATMSARKLAQNLAFMPQSPVAPPGVTIRELVAYGRSPFNAWYKPTPPSDQLLIDSLIERCDLKALTDRLVHTLSGGERQRAWIAMALAQQPSVLMLDEPVSALDIGHQLEVMDLLKDVNREQQTTLVIVLHDLNLAGRYCDELAAMLDGQIVKAGVCEEVLTPETIERCFNVRANFHNSDGQGPLCSFDRVVNHEASSDASHSV